MKKFIAEIVIRGTLHEERMYILASRKHAEKIAFKIFLQGKKRHRDNSYPMLMDDNRSSFSYVDGKKVLSYCGVFGDVSIFVNMIPVGKFNGYASHLSTGIIHENTIDWNVRRAKSRKDIVKKALSMYDDDCEEKFVGMKSSQFEFSFDMWYSCSYEYDEYDVSKIRMFTEAIEVFDKNKRKVYNAKRYG